MIQIRKQIRIDSPVDKVFTYASEPENLCEIWPSLVRVDNVERSPTAGNSWDWEYKMAGMKFTGHNDTIEFIPFQRVVNVTKGGIPSVFTWDYGVENGSTVLDLTISYTVPLPVLGKLAEKVVVRMNENEIETLLVNLKTIMETEGRS